MKIELDERTIIQDSDDNLVMMNDEVTCGCRDPLFEMAAHIDGSDFYSTVYKCKCGNRIEVKTMRTAEDKSLWMDN